MRLITQSAKISIVMPVLNEAQVLQAQLDRLAALQAAGHELIVVDGGSVDGTPAIAARQAKLVAGERGRARQMNRGAAEAKGDLLLFLHVDTVLPERADALILEHLVQARAQWGWFDARLSHPGLPYRVIGSMMSLRARLTGICTGDQCLFVARDLFERIGGFPDLPLMEDLAIAQALKRARLTGKTSQSHGGEEQSCRIRSVCIRTPVVTSSRRWEEQGVVRTVLLMWKLRLLYNLGVSPERLVREYYPAHTKASPSNSGR